LRCWRRSRTRARGGAAGSRWRSRWQSPSCASWPGPGPSGRSATRPPTCPRTCSPRSAASRARCETAAYIAGERGADYLLTVKGNTPGLQPAIYDKIQSECDPAAPDHTDTDRSHGRTVRRSLWAAAAGEGIDFPHAAQVIRVRRDTLDIDGAMIAKEIVHAATSLDAGRATPEALAALARGQWAIEAVHWIRDTAYREDHRAGYAGDGPQVMATLRNMAISLLRIAGITKISRTKICVISS